MNAGREAMLSVKRSFEETWLKLLWIRKFYIPGMQSLQENPHITSQQQSHTGVFQSQTSFFQTLSV